MSKDIQKTERNGLEVAVIGMALRFPGARNSEEFWNNLENGVESVSFLSGEELDRVEAHMKNDPRYVSSRGGVLEDMECFDAAFFDYPPLEAEIMGPQQRVFHECAWEALEDSGYCPENYRGIIGLYAAASSSVFWESTVFASGKSDILGHFAVDQLANKDHLPRRISYKFNLKGPSISVQTACSSSLVSIHMASRALITGECEIALAGGVTAAYGKDRGYLHQEGMIASPDGHCRAFDAKAAGTIGGNGVGVVVLKSLRGAIADNDHIYAVIKGSAVNNDGFRKVGYSAPSIQGQAEVVRAALRISRVKPENITYIEAHGTGTSLGDPVEIRALQKAFNIDKKNFCRIGSVKTNIGHLDSAAGVAGFIKTVLALKHRQIPPSLHFETPNPNIDFDNSPFFVNTRLREWENSGSPLRAGVSSFGIGGTNAHVILEEASAADISTGSTGGRAFKLMVLSAKTETALREMTGNLGAYLKRNLPDPVNPNNPDPTLADVAYTLQVGRKAFPHRKTFICGGMEEAVEVLTAPGAANTRTGFLKEETSRASVIFMFPGQGSQYVDMGLDLYRTEKTFKDVMDRCFELLKPEMGVDPKDILYPGDPPSAANLKKINQTEIAQPLIFSFEYALARLLMEWGIKPRAFIGHSIGEYTAACLAGVFSLEDALKLVALRGKLMQGLPSGAMLSVSLAEKELKPLLEDGLSLAAVNASSRCVVSGSNEAVRGFENRLKEKGIECRRLHTSHAFHSEMMEPIMGEFENTLRRVTPDKPRIPYMSNVTGTWITAGEAAAPSYWAAHLRRTVRFGAGIEQLLKEENPVFLEVGPGKALSAFVRERLEKASPVKTLNLVRHPREELPDDRHLLDRVGQLWLYGIDIDWSGFHSHEKRGRVPLPTYPFESRPFPVKGDPYRPAAGGTGKKEAVKKTGISDWFHVPVWKQSVVNKGAVGRFSGRGYWVVFADNFGIGTRVAERLIEKSQDVIFVEPGVGFSRASHNTFTLNPGESGDYSALFRRLKTLSGEPAYILHMWGITGNGGTPLTQSVLEGAENAGETGFYSLLEIARAVGDQSFENKIELVVVTDRVHHVTGEENADPVKAAILGPVNVIPREYPNIAARNIDFVFPGTVGPGLNRTADRILDELLMEKSDTVVALRGGYRWVRVFEPVRLDKSSPPSPPLKEKGVYLVTGGLGGIGRVIARYLAEHFKARLVLTGRTFIPPKEDWNKWLIEKAEHDGVSLKIRELMELEESGAEVLAMGADAAYLEQMQAVIARAERVFGTIDGVIHSAGVPDGALIRRRTRRETESILSPKVRGTLVLERVLQGIEPDFFILFSSISSILPPVGQVGYAAANAFLDSFAHYKTSGDGVFTAAVDWCTWKEVGMAVKSPGMEPGHHLFDRYLAEDSRKEVYTSYFRIKNRWFLEEHMFMGRGILPGTVYLEMAAAAFEMHGGEGDIEISDVFFLTPLVIEAAEKKEVRTVLRKRAEDYDFSILSRMGPGAEDWREHARGTVRGRIPGSPVKHDLEKIEKNCNTGKIVNPEQRNTPGAGLEYGPRWQNRQWIKLGENAGLARLRLPGEFKKDIESYRMHPALLDMGTSFLSDHLEKEAVYLPFAYDRLTVSRRLPAAFFAYARMRGGSGGAPGRKTLKYDITFMDEEGIQLMEIEGFTRTVISADGIAGVATVDVPPGRVPVGNMDGNGSRNHSFEYGISPEEGVEAFTRILAGGMPQVVVSPVDVAALTDLYRQLEEPEPGNGEEETVPDRPYAERPELSTQYVSPRDPYEVKVVDIWQRFFGIGGIGVHDDFFELGGDSLKIINMASVIHKEMEVKIPIAEFFNRPRVEGLAEYIKNARKVAFTSIDPQEKKEYYPLSSAQKRVFILIRMDDTSTKFNLPVVTVIEGEFDRDRAGEAFGKLIERQEALRTSFDLIDDTPVQIVHDKVDFSITYSEAAGADAGVSVENFAVPFDLKTAPLFRVGLHRLSDEKFIFMFDIHHIVADAMACEILMEEFLKLYNGMALPPLNIQYRDFARWQNNRFESRDMDKQKEYWLNRFKDSIPLLELPTDFPRPPIQTFEGDLVSLDMGEEPTSRAKEFVAGSEITLYMVILSVYYIVLHKYSGQEDIVINSDTLGRSHVDLQNLIGMFVNFLAMRNFPEGGKTYREFLAEVKANALDAYKNQDFQFDELVEHLDVKRDLSRNPLADVEFSFMDFGKTAAGDPGGQFDNAFKIKPYEAVLKKSAKADITLFCTGGRTVGFHFEYSSSLFKRSTMERFVRCFPETLEYVIRNPDTLLSEIEIISEEEKKKILFEFNDTSRDFPQDKTFAELFEARVKKTPGKIAAVHKNRAITYSCLNERAHHLAVLLKAKNITRNSLVGIFHRRSIEMLTGILGVFKAGAAYVPIENTLPFERVRTILEDSESRVLLTGPGAFPGVEGVENVILPDGPLEEVPAPSPGDAVESQVSDLAYVIYTSGTTGKPKGVMIHQGGMINHLYAKINDLGVTSGDIIAQTASAGFDISVWQFLAALPVGGTTCIIDRSVVLDAEMFLNTLEKERVSILESVPSLMSAFLEMIKGVETKGLKHLRWMIPTGEVLTSALAGTWFKHFPSVKLVNAYGPTEASDDITHYFMGEKPGEECLSIPIGRPLQNLHVYILDKYNALCPIGVRGEICTAGVGVGKGYWKDPGKTAAAFVPNPFLHEIGDPRYGVLYRTGDIGFYREDGNIECLGRMDHQVKIRGNRIEPGEIESQLARHDAVSDAVVVTKTEKNGDTVLCSYFVSDQDIDDARLKAYLSEYLPDYMIPSYFMRLEKMPLSVGGKIDRRALPEPGTGGGARESRAPTDGFAMRLAGIWAEVLGIEVDKIDMGANFFDLGGHSLKATIMASKVHRTFRLKVPLTEIFKRPTLGELASYMKRLKEERYSTIEPVEKKDYYPLSPAQQRMYILQQLNPGSTSYNIPRVIPLKDGAREDRLEKAFREILARHESLRTSFQPVNDEPVQKIHPDVPLEVEYFEDASKERIDSIIDHFVRPFDLSRVPLLRLGLIKTGGGDILLLDMHHIITDDTSQDILTMEFAALYSGKHLPKPSIQYKDYVAWQNSPGQRQSMKQQELYWLEMFSGELPVLDIPLDYPRPEVQTFGGDVVEFALEREDSLMVKALVKKENTTMFMVLFTVFYVFLYKVSRREDIVVGTPVAGRGHADIHHIMGFLVNTLALRNRPSGEKTFKAFLHEVRERTMTAFENQEYQFEDLVNRVLDQRDAGRNPLFDVVFTLHNHFENLENLRPEDVPWEKEPYRFRFKRSVFDLVLHAFEADGQLGFYFEYSTKLFKHQTVEKLVNYFKEILTAVLTDHEVKLKDIRISHNLLSTRKDIPQIDFGF